MKKNPRASIWRKSYETASDVQYYKAVALMVKEMLMEEGRSEFLNRAQKSKKIYYLCMEFLMGRSLKNNLFNLGIEDFP